MENVVIKLIEYHPVLIYLAIFGVLFACGIGLPIPEDITLVAGGYSVYLAETRGLAQPSLVPMIIIGLVGVLVGDIVLFTLGRKLGPRVCDIWPFRAMLSAKRLPKIRGFFSRYGGWTAFAARFAAGLRAPTYLLAGTARMRYRNFLLADGSAALISVPLLIVLAWHFGAEIKRVETWLANSRYAIWALLALGAIWLTWRLWRNYRARSRTARGTAKDRQQKVNPAPDDS